ncbi:MAG: hypothetical protein U0521_19835 [Anaerolineae bacterium]
MGQLVGLPLGENRLPGIPAQPGFQACAARFQGAAAITKTDSLRPYKGGK